MTYPIIKMPQSRQSGVTLLLSILVLAAITAISFSLATVLFAEIRTSSDLTRTEPAIYGANALTEQAIFKIKREVSGTGIYSTKLGAVTFTAPVENSLSDPTQQDKVPASASTFANRKSYVLYSVPDNPASGYGKIIINYPAQSATSALYVYICQYDINNPNPSDTAPACSSENSSNTYWKVNHYTLTSGNSPFIYDQAAGMNPNLQQEIVLVNGGSEDIYIQLSTFDAAGNPKGLPYFGQTSVDSTGNNSGVTRKIHVVIPNNISNSGGGGGGGGGGLPPATAFVTGIRRTTSFSSFTGSLGMAFTVGGTPLTVQSLGRYCVAGNSRTHTMKLINGATGSDIPGSSVNVNMSGCADTSFVYATLSSPVTLAANTRYYVVSSEVSGQDQWYDPIGVFTTSVAAAEGPVYLSGSNYVFLPDSGKGYGPLNFKYQ